MYMLSVMFLICGKSKYLATLWSQRCWILQLFLNTVCGDGTNVTDWRLIYICGVHIIIYEYKYHNAQFKHHNSLYTQLLILCCATIFSCDKKNIILIHNTVLFNIPFVCYSNMSSFWLPIQQRCTVLGYVT